MQSNAHSRKNSRPSTLAPAEFSTRLASWYTAHARDLPWRNTQDPYAIWVSEVMLQQTRVATVIERYGQFIERFPTLAALANAQESEVLALWSGLGYYRRARMLHRGAQYVVQQLNGTMPRTARDLIQLPGVGSYTAAAIASIAFAEPIAVLDGNVERVLLRVTGQAQQNSSAAKASLQQLAQQLMPSASARSPGDHNQAMMELGATVCLPRNPLCLHCPVVTLCRTRGEHVTQQRAQMKQRRVAHLLLARTRAQAKQVMLEQRAATLGLMPGMWELPPLPLDAVQGASPLLSVKHAITDTNYAVDVYSDPRLCAHIPARNSALRWFAEDQLHELPLTGLTRKVLRKAGRWAPESK